MSSDASAISMDSVRGLPTAAKVNVADLVLTAAGMLTQIAAGSTLYPSLAGPIVLVVAALFVTFGPGRWTPWGGPRQSARSWFRSDRGLRHDRWVSRPVE